MDTSGFGRRTALVPMPTPALTAGENRCPCAQPEQYGVGAASPRGERAFQRHAAGPPSCGEMRSGLVADTGREGNG